MNISKVFPTRYLSGKEIEGQEFTLTIKSFGFEEMFDIQANKKVKKPVLRFEGAQKGIVLRKTLALQIAEILGSPETDDWVGKEITVTTKKVNAFGKVIPSIWVTYPNGSAPQDDEF